MKFTYTEKDISYTKNDLEKIRLSPGMYIGPLDSDGIFNLLREVCDNALDEAKAGRNNLVHVSITDQPITVVDAGVGIPVKKHPQAKISTLTYILTVLQSSGKMKGNAYKHSIGRHGAGLKAVNALSSMLKVWTYRQDAGGWHVTEFKQGKQTIAVKKCTAPKLPGGKALKSGTMIQFQPDTSMFGKAKLVVKRVLEWAKISAYLNPNVTIKIDHAGKSQVFLSKNGPADYLENKLKQLELTAVGKPIIASTEAIDIAIAFTESQDCHMDWFTNTVRNADGGHHADSMVKALMASLKPYAGKSKFTVSDLKAGLVGLFNLRMDVPTFSGQTKDKLVDERAKQPCYDEVLSVLTAWWAKNKTQARTIIQRASEYNKAVVDFRQNAKAMRQLKVPKSQKVLLPGKLVQAYGVKPGDKELILVEGDSAAGTCKAARFPHQEVLSLRGKILNAARYSTAKVLESAEVIGILQAIGFNPALKEPTQHLRVGRITLLPDQDVDGRHICSLLLTLLWKYVPSLIKEGRVHTVAAKEFTVEYNGKQVFANSLEEIRKLCDGNLPKNISHIKGWGELEPEHLRVMAFDAKTRRLYRVLPPKDAKSAKEFDLVMAEDPTYRKKLLGV